MLKYVFLFLAAFFAGLVDSIAGGGGLITVPALLISGFPLPMALGTNKFQSSFGSFTAAWRYTKAGGVNPGRMISGIVFTAVGAGIGSALVQLLSGDLLARFIPFLLMGILIYNLLKPGLGNESREQKLTEGSFFVIFGLLLGFYDGFFGPGTGSFWVMAFVLVMGYNFKVATMHTKVMNFTSNIVSLLFFAGGCNIDYLAGGCMAVGQILGARIGSGLVIKRGTKFIRPVFLTVVAAIIIKLFWDEWGR